MTLNQEIMDMYCLDTLYLFGNPIVNSNPQLAKIENNSNQLKKAFESYFGVSSSLGSGFGAMSLGGGIGGSGIGS